jgi:hypothetical protein
MLPLLGRFGARRSHMPDHPPTILFMLLRKAVTHYQNQLLSATISLEVRKDIAPAPFRSDVTVSALISVYLDHQSIPLSRFA